MKEFDGQLSQAEDGLLDRLFREYNAACTGPEPSASFMPGVWRKIEEGRYCWWSAFTRIGRIAAPACAVVCLLLLVLNWTSMSDRYRGWTYTDALAADSTAEQTYDAEAIRTGAPKAYGLGTTDSEIR